MSRTLDDIGAQLDRIEAAMAAKPKATAPRATATKAPGGIADPKDLDGKFGDPEIRKDAPRWVKEGGQSYVGKKYSQTTPDYLDSLAGFLDWQADKDEEKGTDDGRKYAGYKRTDACRARGWAERMRAGWKPAADPFTTPDLDTEIPF